MFINKMAESSERIFSDSYGNHIGMVKWFNHKLGYGFITTVIDGSEQDIFAHQTNIVPKKNSYRTLTAGEYVSFNMSETDDARQSVDITGIQGGPLRCDYQIRQSRNPRSKTQHELDNLEDV